MLKELKLKNIKSFEEATVPMSGFTVLLGTNASGKSNIRDVMRFLHGLSRGYKLVELFAGKYEGSDRIWGGIRGGPNEFLRKGAKPKAGTIDVQFDKPDLDYQIVLQEVRGKPLRIFDEWLRDGVTDLYSTRDANGYRPEMKSSRLVRVWIKAGGRHRKSQTEDALNDEPILTQMDEFLEKRYTNALEHNQARQQDSGQPLTYDEAAQQVRRGVASILENLSSMRFLDLSPNAMREPTFPGPLTIGDSGENLSTVLQNLVESGKRERVILEWLKELTPMDVASLEFERDPRGRISLVLVEHDKRRTPAESASDGTLRFLAYLALAFSTEKPTTCFVEEIDNGIHPARLQLLVELIESQSKARGLQVIASSHSPALMNLLSEDTLLNAALVYRTEESKNSKVKLLRDLPNFETLSKKRQPGALMETGWFENTVESLEYVEDEQ